MMEIEAMREDTTDPTEIRWFGANLNLFESALEAKERKEAIEYQLREGIIDEYGFPAGLTLKSKISLLPDGHPVKLELLKKLREIESKNAKKRRK